MEQIEAEDPTRSTKPLSRRLWRIAIVCSVLLGALLIGLYALRDGGDRPMVPPATGVEGRAR
jgi:hypothetical protein